ncbi:MAG: molecular chaperone DnaJ [Polyangiaceae bacterium]|nr:molecular chaperone DnaJ [Polyangiaceae bacterium]
MSEKRCYYEVLGVTKTASADEIRKAYRQSALKNHPDRNPGDDAAESRFKEATCAFQVLSDDDKRARYDRFGHAGVDGSGAPDFGPDIFSHFQDIFSEFFGGGPRRGGGRARGPSRGSDLRVQQRLTLKESLTGCKREVMLRTPSACETCEGTGAKPGTKRRSCTACGGAGQVSTARGFVMFTQTCHECGGEGSVVKTPCETCSGIGQVEKSRKVVVSFPAGIDSGQRLRVPGQGMPGHQNGPPGDLFVDVEIAQDASFERDGLDLITKLRISVAQAALGTKRELTLPDDSTVTVEIPAGTQPGEVVTTRNRGVPRIDGRGRGALHVIIQVAIPKDLSSRAKSLLRDLESELKEEQEEPKAQTA